MNLTWHIIKKDLRALKWPLLLWSLLIGAKLGVGVMLLAADGTEEAEWFTRMDGLAKMFGAFECVSFVLAAAVVQQDLLVGTQAFWLTRPISGARLLRAKLMTLLLVFGVLPLLITLPWWLGCGYGWREIGWAALETSSLHLICVLFGLLWAVVTDGFARFLMWTLVTLFAIPSLTATLAYYATRGHPGPSGDLVASRFAVGSAITLVGILAVVVHQYLTRNSTRSIGIIATAASLIIAVGVWWPWPLRIESRIYDFVIRHAEGEWPEAAEPAGLKFSLSKAQLTPARAGAPAKSPARVRLELTLDGLTKSQGVAAYYADSTWRWPDGTSERSNSVVQTKGLPLPGILGAPSQETYAETAAVVAFVTPQVAAKLRAEPVAYTLKARLRLMKFASATPVPQQPGGRTQQGVLGERLAHVERSGEQLLVTFVRHAPSLLGENAGFGHAPSGQFAQYVLVNKAGDFQDEGTTVTQRSTRIGTVEIMWHTMAYRAYKYGGGQRPLLAAMEALNDAQLIKVTYTEQARFTHEIKADPLVFETVSP